MSEVRVEKPNFCSRCGREDPKELAGYVHARVSKTVTWHVHAVQCSTCHKVTEWIERVKNDHTPDSA